MELQLLLGSVTFSLFLVLALLFSRYKKFKKSNSELKENIEQYEKRITDLQELVELTEKIKSNTESKYAPLINNDAELARRKEELERVGSELHGLKNNYEQAFIIYKNLKKQIDLFQESLDLSEYGVYQPRYFFDLPQQYQLELEAVYRKQTMLVQIKKAAICNIEWTVGDSKAEGRRMTEKYIKLMLYAFNGECDALIAKVKWNNVNKTKDRIRKAFTDINKLGETHKVYITNEYLELKLSELALVYEYEQKKYEEKEEQRRIREQMREEERAQKEYEKEQKEGEDVEKRYEKALEKAKKVLGLADASEMESLNTKIKELERSLEEAHQKKERAISMAQMTKVGHIYVISNIGSFGEDIYKIGMTRRLDPLDRVKELGDASVPFQFDIHAIIYCENAPQLEYELHKKFSDKRINRINGRKEFFNVSLDEIETFIKQQLNAEIQITKIAEAKEYRETLNLHKQINSQDNKNISVFPETVFG